MTRCPLLYGPVCCISQGRPDRDISGTIPRDERVESIGSRVAENEADMLLTWAVAGASQLIRQRGFTIPPSSKTALRDWLLSADPVLAWIQSCVEEIDAKSPEAKGAMIKSKDAHADFVRWAKGEGFREITLPAVNGFVHRLRANRPSIDVKHTNSGNFLTGIRIVSAEYSRRNRVLSVGPSEASMKGRSALIAPQLVDSNHA
jgi:hypothetical protein